MDFSIFSTKVCENILYCVPPVSVALFVYSKRPMHKTNKRNLLYIISFQNPSPKTP